MAFSNSIRRSQERSFCQLCEVSPNIKVKCLDCDLLMCEKCKEKVHLKFKHADTHQVVPLKEIGLYTGDQGQEQEFKPVKCNEHKKKTCCMFCKTCEKLVCPTCIFTEHKPHQMTEIEAICKTKVDELADHQAQMNRSVNDYLRNINILKDIEDMKYSEVQQQIPREREEATVKLQQEYAEKLSSLQEERKILNTAISLKEKQVVQRQREIEKLRKNLEDVFNTRDTENILQNAQQIHGKLKDFSKLIFDKTIKIKTMEHIPGKTSVKMESKIMEMDMEVTTTGSYKTDFSFVRTMACDKDGALWIANANTIKKLNPKKQLEVLRTFPGPSESEIMEMRCSKSNKVLITSGSEILLLKTDGRFEIFKSFAPDFPATLHISLSNTIIVGMDYRQCHDTTDKLVLVVLTSDGTKVTEYVNKGRKLLLNEIVRSCTTMKDDTICYIDSNWGLSGDERVVKLDKKGIIQWIYTGSAAINSADNQFSPIEVLCSDAGNIIVSDKFVATLHVLSLSGTLLTIIQLTFLEIETLGIMVFDANKTLWVHDNGKLHSLPSSGL